MRAHDGGRLQTGAAARTNSGDEVVRHRVPAEGHKGWKGGHSRLLMLKRLAQAREGGTAQASARQRGGLDRHMHNPSTGPVPVMTTAGGKRLLSPSWDWLLDRGFM
ncbi:MAG: hypothetical protein NVSMB18_08370 [Acetobacteraceae bacterium]